MTFQEKMNQLLETNNQTLMLVATMFNKTMQTIAEEIVAKQTTLRTQSEIIAKAQQVINETEKDFDTINEISGAIAQSIETFATTMQEFGNGIKSAVGTTEKQSEICMELGDEAETFVELAYDHEILAKQG